MKLDNIDGPLFAEMNFYLRVAKEESINEWMSKKGLKFLAIPKYIASGIHDKSPNNKTIASNNSLKAKRNGPTLQYRFLVMQRFGDELQKLVTDNKLTTSKACDIASKMIGKFILIKKVFLNTSFFLTFNYCYLFLYIFSLKR